MEPLANQCGALLRLLGPVEAWAGPRKVDLGPRRQRFVLAVLALEVNHIVTVERMIRLAWPGEPPRTAVHAVRVCVSGLRGAFAAAGVKEHVRLVTRGSGYALLMNPECVDAHRFRALLVQAREDMGDEQRVAVLDRALALWSGPPLVGTAVSETSGQLCKGLEESRLVALEDRCEALLRLGRHREILDELTGLVGTYPMRQRLVGQLMLALYHDGQVDASLALYRDTRRLLAEELGLDPGPELVRAEQIVLRGEPGPQASVGVPRQLPAPPPLFEGRTGELADLERVHDASAVVISAIDGMAGVGKTALAVHAAHRLADRYPDGQLFIDLHGYTPGVAPIGAAEALDHLLRALGIPGAQIPAGLDQRAGLYRTRLADQRVLIVLDNAAAEAQVAPLLPGAPGCLVLVTSRRRLAGLDHTHALSLDTLPTPDAVALFVRTACRTGESPELVTELVELCGRLPLAIRIAAARLRSHPAWNLSDLVARLRDQRQRLVELAAGQRSVTVALDLSYQDLSLEQREAYRLLGLHPGPEFDTFATAALLDATRVHAARILDQLLEAHLLQEPALGRYRFHDLIRAHAAHAAARDQPERAQDAALGRLLDYYRYTASVAMDAAYPYDPEDRPRVTPANTPTPDLPDPEPAQDWLDTELSNLLAVARYATEHGLRSYILDLSTSLRLPLRTRGRYDDAEALHQQALATAHAAGDQAAQLTALNSVGQVYFRQGRYGPAADHFRQALRIARTIGHRVGEMIALSGIGQVHLWQGRYGPATDHFRQALRIARTIGHRVGEMIALTGIGDIHRSQGRYGPAADHFRQGLQIARAIGHPPGEVSALNGLGYLHRSQGRYEQAGDHYQRALRIARTIGHRAGEMHALYGLGYIHRTQSRYEQAAEHYRRLLDLAQECGDRNWQFEAWQGMGRLRHATGGPDAAIAHHEQALALVGELNQPYDQARAHDGLAHAYHAANQHRQARQHWHHALDILTSLGIDHTDDHETTTTAIRAHLAALTEL